MSEPTDVELVGRLGSPDRAEREEAFSLLFQRHRQRAFDLAWRVLGDPGLAADAVQEAFVAVYRKGPRFEARAQFSSWLYRIVLNQSIDLRRREKRHRALQLGTDASGVIAKSGTPRGSAPVGSQEELPSQRPPPDSEALQAERMKWVREAIGHLSPKLAAVVALRYPEGMSYEEIGQVLGLPPGTVRSRLNRAHAALREILGERLDDH